MDLLTSITQIIETQEESVQSFHLDYLAVSKEKNLGKKINIHISASLSGLLLVHELCKTWSRDRAAKFISAVQREMLENVMNSLEPFYEKLGECDDLLKAIKNSKRIIWILKSREIIEDLEETASDMYAFASSCFKIASRLEATVTFYDVKSVNWMLKIHRAIEKSLQRVKELKEGISEKAEEDDKEESIIPPAVVDILDQVLLRENLRNLRQSLSAFKSSEEKIRPVMETGSEISKRLESKKAKLQELLEKSLISDKDEKEAILHKALRGEVLHAEMFPCAEMFVEAQECSLDIELAEMNELEIVFEALKKPLNAEVKKAEKCIQEFELLRSQTHRSGCIRMTYLLSSICQSLDFSVLPEMLAIVNVIADFEKSEFSKKSGGILNSVLFAIQVKYPDLEDASSCGRLGKLATEVESYLKKNAEKAH